MAGLRFASLALLAAAAGAVRVNPQVEFESSAVAVQAEPKDEELVPILKYIQERGGGADPNQTALIEGGDEKLIPNFIGGGLIWPDCNQKYPLAAVVQEAAAWCDANLVPEEKRAPAKLQGLYWLKGLPLEDVAVCFSTGEWDEEAKTLKLSVYRDFMYIDSYKGTFMASVAFQLGMTYLVAFEDAELTTGHITPMSTGSILQRAMGTLPLWIFSWFAEFPITEFPGAVPGEKWLRPSWFGLGSSKVLTNQYEVWRVMDGNLKAVDDNADLMFHTLFRRVEQGEIIRYFDKKGWFPFSTCASETPKLKDPIPCSAGVFVEMSNSPTLGLRHVRPQSKTPMPFAKASLGPDCTLLYSLRCDAEEHVEVVETKSCASDPTMSVLIHSLSARQGKVRGDWKVCSRWASEYQLELAFDLVDLTWDTAVATGTTTNGCLQLYPTERYPQLSGVRGSPALQTAELKAVKAKLGGCPTVTTDKERFDRGLAFKDQKSADILGVSRGGQSLDALGPWMYILQKVQANKADAWARGVATWGDGGSWIDKAKDVAGTGLSFAFFGLSAKSNRTTGFLAFAEVNCGQPSPFIDGPQYFRHQQVADAAADPNQVRTYRTATVQQVEMCFDPTLPLFQSSGSEEHTAIRKLLDAAGFDRLTDVPLPEVSAVLPDSESRKVGQALGDTMPTETEVGRLVLPLVMKGIWEKEPGPRVVENVLQYLGTGKTCIFGKIGEKLIGSKKAIVVGAREAMRNFGSDSPRAQKLAKALQEPAYKPVLDQYTKREAETGRNNATHLLVQNVADGVLFAGLLGTTDMATKCVQYQYRDQAHVRMFRKDPTAYLHELMRYDGAVTSFTSAMYRPEPTMKIEGRDVTFPPGAPTQLVLGSANRDAAVFAKPSEFNPARADIGEQVAWNGRLKHVIARDYSNAPRFCPGYHLSVKVASAVCQHLTKDLAAWGEKGKETRAGLVMIMKPGSPYNGEVALVTHYVASETLMGLVKKPTLSPVKLGQAAYKIGGGLSIFWGNYCVISPKDNSFIGCFPPSELKQLDTLGGGIHTLADEAKRCPAWIEGFLNSMVNWGLTTYEVSKEQNSVTAYAFEVMFGKNTPGKFSPEWADHYALGMYIGIIQSLKGYRTRHNTSVAMPTHIGDVDILRIGHIFAPLIDIDMPTFYPNDDWIPKYLLPKGGMDAVFLPSLNCFLNALRTIEGPGKPFDDDLVDPARNTWEPLLRPKTGKQFPRKKDWLLSWYESYSTADGLPMWPTSEVNFAAHFLKDDIWDDGLERAMVFNLIAAHRAVPVKVEDPSIAYAVKLNSFSGIVTRPHFGRYGGDMFFNTDGFPMYLVTPSGETVHRGDRTWQYWKFAWRSSLVTGITLVDHLHMTHFRAANVLAKVSRQALRPNHPMRRFMSIFTFGSIAVNLQAMHALVGPGHSLHRSSPFLEFESLSDMVPTMLPDLLEAHKAFHNESAWAAMPKLLQDAPYYADGKLLYQAIYRLLTGFLDVYRSDWCSASGELVDWEMKIFRDDVVDANEEGEYAGLTDEEAPRSSCEALLRRLAAALFTVTGWHRHVGTVGDYYADPDLASFSWKDGEAYPRPKQHMILSVIAASTATTQPKLNEDYSHMFAGIEKEAEAVAVWGMFREDLAEVGRLVKERNADRVKRGLIANIHADPSVVECSVAV